MTTWATPLCPDRCRCQRLKGRAAQQRNARILRASDVCHLCGQPGSDAVDHVIPWAKSHNDSPSNLKPAHHYVEPKCNMVKGDREYAHGIIRRSGSLT